VKIDKVFSVMKACYFDWEDYLINPNYIQRGSAITWSKHKSGIRNSTVRLSDVRGMDEEGQYTYLVESDRSVIQLFYGFDPKTDEITTARLAYYSGNEDAVYVDAELMNHGIVPISEGDSLIGQLQIEGDDAFDPVVGWIRIDYDPSAKQIGITHPLCHMHLSGFPESRLVVRGLPSPRQFIEFVFCSFYPNIYSKHRLNRDETQRRDSAPNILRDQKLIRDLNSDSFPFADDPIYNMISHVRVPSIS